MNARAPARPARWLVAALAAVLLIGAGTVALLRSGPDGSEAATGVPLADLWPQATPVTFPADLAGGPAYRLEYVLDGGDTLGTSPDPDGTHQRLVLRHADGEVRQLRRLPVDRSPGYSGFTRDGAEVAWAESTTDPAGRVRHEIWALTLGGTPRLLTADTGAFTPAGSEHDLVIHDGRLHWVAAAAAGTELRSVPLSGGEVEVRTAAGHWRRTTWPWLVPAGDTAIDAPVLRDSVTGGTVRVPVTADELATCGARWCRVLVHADAVPTATELMRTDGSDRRRIAGPQTEAIGPDVTALDRFVPLLLADAERIAADGRELLLHDITSGRTAVVAQGVRGATVRGGTLWWSTSDERGDPDRWHLLDLRDLD